MQMERHEHAEESINSISISCQNNICTGCWKAARETNSRRKGRRNISVGKKKARVGEHQRNHQCETLPCPWQLRLRTAQQLMHHRALSQRHILWKVGQNKERSGNYQWIFPEYTMCRDKQRVRLSISTTRPSPLSGCHHASTISLWVVITWI